MNSQEYYEMCEHLKQINDRRDFEEKKIKDKINETHKTLISVYGIVRLISNMADPTEIDGELYILIETLRGLLSDVVEDEILQHSPYFYKE